MEPETRQDGSPTIPKFGSFKSKDPNDRSKPKSEIAFAIRQHSSSGRTLEHGHSQERALHANEGRETGRNLFRGHHLSKLEMDTGEFSSNTYTVDRRGDTKNLDFESFNRHSLPEYVRAGRGSLIGLPSARKIDNHSYNGRTSVIVTTGQSQVNYSHSLKHSTLGKSNVGFSELLLPPTNSREGAERDDFVPFQEAPSSVEKTANILKTGDEDSVKHKTESTLDVASPSMSRPAFSRAAENGSLSAKCEQDPGDVEGWLQLIASDHLSSGCNQSTPESRSNAHVKISLYERALKSVREPKARERLLVGMMQEGKLVWDEGILSAKWQFILKQNPGYLDLWLCYLDYRQTNPHDFAIDDIRQTYLRFIEVLQDAHSSGNIDQGRLFRTQLYVLLRMTLFERESGYSEIAVCKWQAILEFCLLGRDRHHFHAAEAVGSSEAQKLRDFEQFWESEAPRIGEKGAQGWMKCHQHGLSGPLNSADESARAEAPSFEAVDPIHWASAERQHNQLSRYAARMADETSKEDPFQVVLFSDIEPFLFQPPDGISALGAVDAFLTFCGLPNFRSSFEDAERRRWRTDAFVRNEQLYDKSVGGDLFHASIGNHQVDQHTLFPADQWFETISSNHLGINGNFPITSDFLLRVLDALIDVGVGGDELAEYCLALRLKLSPATARKEAKSLLKRFPSRLRLYNALALIEYRMSNPTRGGSILVKTLQMIDQFGDDSRLQSVVLWRTWLWEFLRIGKDAQALQQFSIFGNEHALRKAVGFGLDDVDPHASSDTQGKTVSLGKALKYPSLAATADFFQKLNDVRDSLLNLHLFQPALAAAECQILLTYMQESSSLQAAAAVHNHNVQIFSQKAALHTEVLHQSFAYLIYSHVTRTRLINLGVIRTLLEESITAYPENTILLSLLAWNESKLGVEDKLRSRVDNVLLDSQTRIGDSVVPYSFQIDVEIARRIRGTNGSTNVIRGAFEHALRTKPCSHSAGLWKRYFLFEKAHGSPISAERVLFRALQACPWVKELFLLAMEHLSFQQGGVNHGRSRALYDLMEERGLRLHMNLRA